MAGAAPAASLKAFLVCQLGAARRSVRVMTTVVAMPWRGAAKCSPACAIPESAGCAAVRWDDSPYPRRGLSRACVVLGIVVGGCSSGVSTTTKSATSQLKGGVARRSPDRRSAGADSHDVRRSSVRRSQDSTTGNCAVLHARASKRRNAPRRTTMPRGFIFAIQGPYRSLRFTPAGGWLTAQRGRRFARVAAVPRATQLSGWTAKARPRRPRVRSA